MAWRTWRKSGVIGDLQPIAQKGFGKLESFYWRKGLDFFCTSLREGTHGAGSLHYIGLAFDFHGQDVPKEDLVTVLGPGWQVVVEGDHYHAEYDPIQTGLTKPPHIIV